MALYKEIRQPDGVFTSYHRIIYIMSFTNSHVSIAVASYVDEDIRTAEKNNVITQPYIQAVTYETGYVENMTIETAYNYLKTLPDFEGATDILEEDANGST